MRLAYSRAVNNALINAIREYYKENNPDNIPDISREYIKFIRSYSIISQAIEGSTIYIRLSANIDDIGLQDAKIYIDNPVDSAVFVFSGINEEVLPLETQAKIIERSLVSKNFSTNDQRNFIYNINNMKSKKEAEEQFKNVYSHYLFRFIFSSKFEDFSNSDHNCELITTTDIVSKDGFTQTLKVETYSSNTDKNKCISDAMSKAIVSTIDYIRNNLIEAPDTTKELYTYYIKVINFKNMVGTNNFFAALKKRGFIKDYKATSFSGKEVSFKIDSYFDKNDLSTKLYSVNTDDLNFTYEVNNDGIILDFASDDNNN